MKEICEQSIAHPLINEELMKEPLSIILLSPVIMMAGRALLAKEGVRGRLYMCARDLITTLCGSH